ncbi:WD40 repeat domain-containing protein [Plantactinospora sp. B24E8]|uniref:WD40 repeat domain-containing protein n=1 Tax=Plantactinospora sp. B24E8 TaxID=3153567 RepID=UPI00325CDE8A
MGATIVFSPYGHPHDGAEAPFEVLSCCQHPWGRGVASMILQEGPALDRFERMLTFLRRGQADHAERLRGEGEAEWLPSWTAGDPLSPAFRQAHQLGSLIKGMRLDDTYAWALAADVVYRISLSDGVTHRVRLRGWDEINYDAVLVGDTVVAVEDERLLVWDLATGRLLLATDPDDIPRRAGGLRSLAVGAGVAVTGTEGGYLLQWDLATGRLLARTAAHGGRVGGVAISTDGAPVVLSFGGEDDWTQTLCFHDLDGLRRTGEAPTPEWLRCASWTMLDGQRRAVTVADSGLLTVWDPTTTAPVAKFSTGTHPSDALTFTADGACAVIGVSRALRIVDLRDGTVRGSIRTDFTHDVDDVVACGRFIFAAQGGSSEGRVNLLELTDPLPRDAEDRPRLIDASAATVDGRAAVVGVDEFGQYRVYDSTDGRELRLAGQRTSAHPLIAGHVQVRTVDVGGRDLAVSVERLQPTVVDPATGEIRAAPQRWTSGPVLSAVAARDGLVAMIDRGGTLAVWDVATLTRRASTRLGGTLPGTSVALGDLAGRTVVLSGDGDGRIRLFDGADLTEIPPHGRFAEAIDPTEYTVDRRNWPGPHAITALDVAGGVVVSALNDIVTCTDLVTGERSGPTLTHPGKVWAILPTVFDGGPVVVTSCADQVLRVWGIATGRTILTVALPRPVHQILSASTDQIIVRDDGYLVSISPSPRPPLDHEASRSDGPSETAGQPIPSGPDGYTM